MVTVGLAGAALGMRATFDPYAGATQLIFAFEAAVIGGAGSLWGTLLGGIVLGVAQSLGAQIDPQGFLIAGHAVFLVVLFARLCLGGLGALFGELDRARAHERASARSASSAGRALSIALRSSRRSS